MPMLEQELVKLGSQKTAGFGFGRAPEFDRAIAEKLRTGPGVARFAWRAVPTGCAGTTLTIAKILQNRPPKNSARCWRALVLWTQAIGKGEI